MLRSWGANIVNATFASWGRSFAFRDGTFARKSSLTQVTFQEPISNITACKGRITANRIISADLGGRKVKERNGLLGGRVFPCTEDLDQVWSLASHRPAGPIYRGRGLRVVHALTLRQVSSSVFGLRGDWVRVRRGCGQLATDRESL